MHLRLARAFAQRTSELRERARERPVQTRRAGCRAKPRLACSLPVMSGGTDDPTGFESRRKETAMLKIAPPVALLSTAGAALAHPGHDAAAAQGAAHWLTEWSHWIVLALAGLVVAELGRRAVRALLARRSRREDRA
jgi:hypothetical protein